MVDHGQSHEIDHDEIDHDEIDHKPAPCHPRVGGEKAGWQS
jgi:hypothetical protein